MPRKLQDYFRQSLRVNNDLKGGPPTTTHKTPKEAIGLQRKRIIRPYQRLVRKAFIVLQAEKSYTDSPGKPHLILQDSSQGEKYSVQFHSYISAKISRNYNLQTENWASESSPLECKKLHRGWSMDALAQYTNHTPFMGLEVTLCLFSQQGQHRHI